MYERAAIEIAGVSRRFDHVAALDAIALSIPKGELFALVGPDGAGKTTLLRVICGALAVDAGELYVDGIDVVRQPYAIQAAIGYMPARFSLYPDLSVRENLRFYAEIFGVPREVYVPLAASLLADFDLAAYTDRLAEELSGGMKQKLALACALIHRPKTILLDEPTAGVDPVSRREFWKILYAINGRGTTILVCTPYMDEAERAARVGFIAEGKLLACGAPAELTRAFGGHVIEIRCSDTRAARILLRASGFVHSVELFGDALHALVDSADEAVPAISRALDDAHIAGAEVRTIPPSLEDAFVARLAS